MLLPSLAKHGASIIWLYMMSKAECVRVNLCSIGGEFHYSTLDYTVS